jgi:restriction system protein
MKPGDWVAVPTKRKTIHIGEIKTEYHYNASGEDPYFHYRGVEWLETDIPRTNFDQDILDSLGAIMTICRIKRNDAEQRVRAMKGNDWQTTRPQIKIPDKIANLDEVDPDDTDFLRDLEEMAQDHIARMIQAKFKSHKMETLIEAILQAQGYTTRKSDPGADGGVDILAAPGRLGFDRPRICVQVKSQQTPLKREVLDQLLGTMSNVAADQGLLVCWGGFKKTILDEIPRLFFKVRMWDQSDVVQQFLAHYDKLDEDIQAEIPLKRIWVVAAQETEGD